MITIDTSSRAISPILGFCPTYEEHLTTRKLAAGDAGPSRHRKYAAMTVEEKNEDNPGHNYRESELK